MAILDKEGLGINEVFGKRRKLEQELKELDLKLKEIGTDTFESLLDKDGFPRADIDIVEARKVRAEIIVKQNDLKEVMAEIEKLLEVIHKQQTSKAEEVKYVPFCRVDVVTPGSPADASGLKTGDRIIHFGQVNCTNHLKLTKIQEELKNNGNNPTKIVVERYVKGEVCTLELEILSMILPNNTRYLGCQLLRL